jgi:predicted phage terminase large subunit-like protein
MVKRKCSQCGKIKSLYSKATRCPACIAEEKVKLLAEKAHERVEVRAAKLAKKIVAKKSKALTKVVAKKAQVAAKLKAKPEIREIERAKAKQKKTIEEFKHLRKKQVQAYANEERRVEKEQKLASEDTSDVEKELIRRELSRRKLIWFTKHFTPRYDVGWLHREIADNLEAFLEDVVAAKNPRLMLFVPPRHGKSELVSRKFPAWALGKYPWLEFISASYDLSLPMEFSRHNRALLRDPYYKRLFETRLDNENQNVEWWRTSKGGGFLPAGVAGPITGKGAHILNIDDPVKNAEDADSETIRAKAWDWFGSTAMTRLAPQSGVVLTMTRWHDADLAGMALDRMYSMIRERDELVANWRAEKVAEGEIERLVAGLEEEIDLWKVIKYPAIAEEDESNRKKGEALHPTRFPVARLMRIKNSAMQPRHWSALYQQNPIPDEGLYFKAENIRYSSRPSFEQYPVRIAFDLAIGQKQSNDYTVGVAGCLDEANQVHVLEMVRGRWDTDEIAEAILGMYMKYAQYTSNVVVGIERGQLELAVRPALRKLMDERKLYPAFDDTLKPITDKMVRARPLQGIAQRGLLLFPTNTPWVEVAVHELLRFPGGVNDDIVDALAWLARMFVNVSPPKRKMPKPPKSWKDNLKLTNSAPGVMAA